MKKRPFRLGPLYFHDCLPPPSAVEIASYEAEQGELPNGLGAYFHHCHGGYVVGGAGMVFHAEAIKTTGERRRLKIKGIRFFMTLEDMRAFPRDYDVPACWPWVPFASDDDPAHIVMAREDDSVWLVPYGPPVRGPRWRLADSFEKFLATCERGVVPEAETETSPLVLAVYHGDEQALCERVAAGANLNEFGVDSKDRQPTVTPLGAAAGISELRLARLLVEHGANLECGRHRWGRSPLMLAGGGEMARLLLELGASIAATDEEGFDPLQDAVASSFSPDVISVLLEYGADPRRRNRHGMSAIDYARRNEAQGIVEMLERC